MRKRNNKKTIITISIILGLVIVGGIVFFLTKKNDGNSGKLEIPKKDETIEPEKKITIVDMDSKERPYAVMINNHNESRPQAGLDKAYMIYEFNVEYGITRMLALFTTDADVSKIGSIRSSRHYYLDYALENDAIYVHWGWSQYAKDDISKLKINNINGLEYGDTYFTTDSSLNRALEHTRFTNSDSMKKAIKDFKYRTERNNDYLLNYTADEVDLSNKEGSIPANSVNITYSNYMTANYSYNSEDKMYYRSINNSPMTDLVTGQQYKFKNIIAYSVPYKTISSKGHQDISNIGNGKGYYITNGYAIPIKWSKTSRSEQTKYTYIDGSEIDVSDGNTFIQIYPSTGNLSIK